MLEFSAKKLRVNNLTEHLDLSEQKVAKSGACDQVIDGFIPFGGFWTSEVGSCRWGVVEVVLTFHIRKPVFEVLFFSFVIIVTRFSFVVTVTRVQPFFLVKLHVLRPVACSYSKMLGEVQSQIYPRSMTMWFWPSKTVKPNQKTCCFFRIPTKKIHLLEDAIVFFGRAWMKQVATVSFCARRLRCLSRRLLPKSSKISSFAQIDRPCRQWTVFLLTVHSFLNHNYNITILPPYKAMSTLLELATKNTWHRIFWYSWPPQILSKTFFEVCKTR